MKTISSTENKFPNQKNMMLILASILIALCILIAIMVYSASSNVKIEQETLLSVSDKPYIAAMESIPEPEPEPEPVEEVYYEPAYTYSNSYWYESDDEDAEAAAREWIAQRESGGDYNATNGRYIGRYQLDSSYLDGDYSEEAQEAAAEAYIADRYGSWQAAQEHHESYGWY